MAPDFSSDLAVNPRSHATLYVAAVISLSVLAIAAILTIFIVRPDKDNTPLVAVILGFLVPLVSTFLAASVRQVHLAVNGRLTQLLAQTAKSSHAEGQLAGQGEAARVIEDASKVAAAKGGAAPGAALAGIHAAVGVKRVGP